MEDRTHRVKLQRLQDISGFDQICFHLKPCPDVPNGHGEGQEILCPVQIMMSSTGFTNSRSWVWFSESSISWPGTSLRFLMLAAALNWTDRPWTGGQLLTPVSDLVLQPDQQSETDSLHYDINPTTGKAVLYLLGVFLSTCFLGPVKSIIKWIIKYKKNI